MINTIFGFMIWCIDDISNNTDLMHALLISSDPVISPKRKILKTPFTELPSSVKQLIIIDNDEETEGSDICSDSE